MEYTSRVIVLDPRLLSTGFTVYYFVEENDKQYYYVRKTVQSES